MDGTETEGSLCHSSGLCSEGSIWLLKNEHTDRGT
jgi:hypothetical protein